MLPHPFVAPGPFSHIAPEERCRVRDALLRCVLLWPRGPSVARTRTRAVLHWWPHVLQSFATLPVEREAHDNRNLIGLHLGASLRHVTPHLLFHLPPQTTDLTSSASHRALCLRIWPSTPTWRLEPKSVKFGRLRANLGQMRLQSTQCWSTSAQIWSIRCRSKLPQI